MSNEKFLKKFIGRTELMGKEGIIGLMDSAHININMKSNKRVQSKKKQFSNLAKITIKPTEIQKSIDQNNNLPENKKLKNFFDKRLMKSLKVKIRKYNAVENNNINNDLCVKKSPVKIKTNQIYTLNNYLSKRTIKMKTRRSHNKSELPKRNLNTFSLINTEHNKQNFIPIPKLNPFYYLPSLNSPTYNRQLLEISSISKPPLPIFNYNQEYATNVKNNNNIISYYNMIENNKMHTTKNNSKSLNLSNTKEFEINRVKDYFKENIRYFPNINLNKDNVNYNVSKNMNVNLYKKKKTFKKAVSDLSSFQSFDNILNTIKEEDDEDNKNKKLIKKSRNYRQNKNNNMGYFSLNEESEIDKLINQRKMYQKLLPKNSIFRINDESL